MNNLEKVSTQLNSWKVLNFKYSEISNRLLDLSNYPKGIYFLYIQSETESLSQKLILH